MIASSCDLFLEFNSDIENFDHYLSMVEIFAMCYGVGDNCKLPFFLAIVGPNPNKPIELQFNDVIKLFIEHHLCPQPLIHKYNATGIV